MLETKLSTLNVAGVCTLLHRIEDLNGAALSNYKRIIQDNNINGRVLLHCDLDELKKVYNYLFKSVAFRIITIINF